MKNNFQIFKFSNLAMAVFAPFALFAQVDRTHAPNPGPAPIVKVGNPATFVLPNGLKVYVVQNSKLPKVTASLSLDYDPIIEGDKAGYTEIAGSLMGEGTKTKTKDVLDEEVDFLGADLNTTATSASVNALSNNFTKAFALMADVVLNPAFPKDEFDKIKKRTLSSLQTKKDDPNAISKTVLQRIMYGSKHPYGETETEKTVEKVTIEDVKKYYSTYWKPNIAYLVFVGDITPSNAQKLATQYFGKWQRGIIPKFNYPVPQAAAKTIVAVVDRPSAVQSVITLAAPVQLKPGSENAIPARILSNILGGGDLSSRLNTNLREKHAFTYGAYGGVSSDKLVGSFNAETSVRNEKTDSAIQEFLNEFNKIRKEPVTTLELSSMKNSLTGSFARSLEQPSTIASFALNVARYNLPKDYYQKYLSNLAAVNVGTVQQVANKYITPNNLYIVVVGSAKEVAKGLEKYGEVKYYDMDGNETKAPTNKAVDASITGESIIKKYITAIGGEATVSTLKDLDMSGTSKIEGAPMDFAFTQKYILPKHFSMNMTAGPMVLFSQSVKNGVYAKSQQGQNVPLEEDEKEELDEEAYFVNEVYYQKNNYTYTVKGIEGVDGKDAYAVEIKSAKGRIFTNYYDVETGLKVKNSHLEDAGPQGKVNMYTTYGGYKTFNGVQMPTDIVSFVGVKISMTIKDVKVNTGLKEEDIK
jgi:predicted Zn-dependent peptidase